MLLPDGNAGSEIISNWQNRLLVFQIHSLVAFALGGVTLR